MVSSLIVLNKYFEFRIGWLLQSKGFSQHKLTLRHVSTSLVVCPNGHFPVFGFHEFRNCTSSTASNNKSDFQLLRMTIELGFEHERYAELENFP